MTSSDELKRVVVIGTAGSGKTTLGKRLAARLGVPHVELDSLNWGSDWTPVGEARFLAQVRAAATGKRWVIDGNYSITRPITWVRATHIIWLDFSFPRVLFQLFLRTMRRSIGGDELFGGNRESLSMAFLSRDSILLYALTTFHRRRRQYQGIMQSSEYPHVKFIVLQSPRQQERWLEDL